MISKGRIRKFEKFFHRCHYDFAWGSRQIHAAAGINIFGGTQGTNSIYSQIDAVLAYFVDPNILSDLREKLTFADLCNLQVLLGVNVLDLGSGGRSYFARIITSMDAQVTIVDLCKYRDYGPVFIAIGNGNYRKDYEIMHRNYRRIVGDLETKSTLNEIPSDSYDMITSSFFISFEDIDARRESQRKIPTYTEEWWRIIHTKLKRGGLSFHDRPFPGCTEVEADYYFVKV